MIELSSLFDVFENTMSAHLREGLPVKVKYGHPGEWKLEDINKKILTKESILDYVELIQEYSKEEENTFIEDESDVFLVIQLQNYRIVITFPPFSDAIEITIVRPTMTRKINDYDIPYELQKRLELRAEGILIAGAPGHGKSTFASALAMFYADNSKIIKTIEKPRDLQLDERITQFTTLEDDIEKLGDLLLLMRPDYVIFDEIRKSKDFEIYSDMRLAGVGMVGVIHATKPIDAIQRFVGRIELGLIPNIIDTVIFIKNGELDSVLSLKMTVKTPQGFTDQGLARPVIEVNDFKTKLALYEMFSFGEQIVVIPIKGRNDQKNKNMNYGRYNKNKKKAYDMFQTKKHLIIKAGYKFSNRVVDLMVGSQIIMSTHVDNYGEIKLGIKKATTRRLVKILDNAEYPLIIIES